MNPVCIVEEVSSATQLGPFGTLTCGGVEVLGAPMWPDRAEAPWWASGLALLSHAADAGETFLS